MFFLLLRCLQRIKAAPKNLHSIVSQMASVGVSTLPIAALMGGFMGMVLALQTGYQLSKLGSKQALGSIVALSMCRELAPVLTGMLLAGRVGSAMAAELGTMSVSEEIDALRTIEVDPIRYLVMPRFLACTLMLPILVIYADIIGILGGAAISTSYFDVHWAQYFRWLFDKLAFMDVFKGLVKAALFGAMIAIVGCYHGLSTTGGAQEVGRSTTRSVVHSFLLIYVFDYFLTRIWL